MDTLLTEMNFTYWTWFVAMLIFLGLEMLMPGIVFLWLGLAAGVLGGLVWLMPDMSWETQFILFALFGVAATLAGRRFIVSRGGFETEDTGLNRRGDAMIGHTYTLVTDMVSGHGKVKVGDTLWSAAGPDAKEGDQVTVTAVEGATLMVKLKE